MSPKRLCFNPSCAEPQNSAEAIRCHHCGSALLLQERYWATQLLGQGGLSRTFLATDSAQSDLAQAYVIKQYRSRDIAALAENRIQPNPDPIDRLKTLAKYPLFPALLDVFEEADSLYLVQAYISGDSLATLLATQGQFKVAEVWQILETVLPIAQVAHSLQLIHGDIKPENIICVRSAQLAENSLNRLANCSLVLVDWGLTSASAQPSGSPEYAAPEQIRGSAGFSSDLYSLGVTCIHLLTGIHPFSLFDVSSNTWVWQNYWVQNAADSSDRYETQALIQLLDRLIAPDLSQRFSTVAEAIAVLQSVRRKKIIVPAVSPRWECYATLVGHQGVFSSVNSVAIAPDNTVLASGSDDKTIRVWSTETGKEQAILQAHTQFVKSVAFHPHDPNVLASGSSDRTIKIWDWQQNQPIQTLAGHTNHVNAIAFSPDGTQIASASADKTVRLWDLQTGCSTVLKGHTLAVQAIAFSPDGTQIASASVDTTVRIWDLATQKQIQRLEGHTWAVRAIAYSPNGNWLATGSEDRTIRVWEPSAWHCVNVLSGHPWAIAALGFFPDSERLISGSWDKTVKFWQVNTGTEITALTGHTDSVNSVAIAIDGSFLATGSKDKTIKLWRLVN
jgi:WD40 repeat protein/tRNA A-37 threonylcarbamoyl transferase component Bud32